MNKDFFRRLEAKKNALKSKGFLVNLNLNQDDLLEGYVVDARSYPWVVLHISGGKENSHYTISAFAGIPNPVSIVEGIAHALGTDSIPKNIPNFLERIGEQAFGVHDYLLNVVSEKLRLYTHFPTTEHSISGTNKKFVFREALKRIEEWSEIQRKAYMSYTKLREKKKKHFAQT